MKNGQVRDEWVLQTKTNVTTGWSQRGGCRMLALGGQAAQGGGEG